MRKLTEIQDKVMRDILQDCATLRRRHRTSNEVLALILLESFTEDCEAFGIPDARERFGVYFPEMEVVL